ncbi:MAG TPA: endonuclease domain-containing protein [Bauldia sp.]|nr:endonuclease domain-containing protein [Bauldia sp.]
MPNRQARYLRQHMTPQEVKLWVHLKAWRANGIRFRRQAPRFGYLVDFVCLKRRVVVELDGSGHNRFRQRQRDQTRDSRLQAAGFKVLRFTNHEIDASLPLVLDAIYDALDLGEAPTPGLRPDPPPSGEG